MGIFSSKTSIEASAILKGKTDAHSHILFGVDDGIKTLEESLTALEYEEKLGIRSVWCTPHIMEEVENTTAALKARFEELCKAYKGPIELHLAAEYMLDSVFDERLAARDLLTREDDMVMVETRAAQPPMAFEQTLAEIQSAGYHVLLAHPERYFYLDKDDYKRLHASGIRFQLNLPSLAQQYGKVPYEKALWLLENGMYHALGSDCHRVSRFVEQCNAKTISKKVCTSTVGL